MIFITGGIGSGKRSFALRELGFTEQDLSCDVLDNKPVCAALHEIVYKRGSFDEELKEALLKKEVVICDEVGCGVVPLDSEERRWRDEVGRAAVVMAGEASTVVRMVCGIPQVIKGTL